MHARIGGDQLLHGGAGGRVDGGVDDHPQARRGLAGRLPAHPALGAFRHVSAHAEAVTFLALAALAAVGVILAAIHVLERRPAKP